MVAVTWAFRSRVQDEGGGSWGTIAGLDVNFHPIDWSVSRSLNSPATAQVVLSVNALNQEQWDALASILNISGPNRYWGLSCFREDFPEEDEGDAVFFGPITTADVTSDGVITIQAEDMLSVAKANLVGNHNFENRDSNTVLTAIMEDWVREQPKATGLQFKGETGQVSYQTEIDQGKTLYDVIQDMCSMTGLCVWHDRSIDIRFATPNTGEPTDLGDCLEGATYTRMFGPESQPNIIRMVGGDNGKDGRSVFTAGGASLGEWEFAVATVETAPDGTSYATMADIGNSRVDQYRTPALTMSASYPWKPEKQFPRPGQKLRVHMPKAFVKPDGQHQSFSLTGMCQSVEISPHTFSVTVATRGGR